MLAENRHTAYPNAYFALNAQTRSQSSMKIAVTGAYGQLGGELCRQLGPAAIPLDIDTLDLTDGRAVVDRMLELKPAAIINCAAYTQVDKAETDAEKCQAVNATAVEHLAQACGMLDCPLLQISTDYIFGAAGGPGRPWREDDPPSPQGVYARTKWEGEQAARRHGKHLIVRTCGLYARPSDPRAVNFVRTMLRLGEHAARAARGGRSALHADLRAASCPGDCLSRRRHDRPRGRLGNVPCDQHRPDCVARVCRGNFPPGGKTSYDPPDHHGGVWCAGGTALVQRARHDGLSPAGRPADARLEGGAGRVFYRVKSTVTHP